MLIALFFGVLGVALISMGVYFFIYPEKITPGINIGKREKFLERINTGIAILGGLFAVFISIEELLKNPTIPSLAETYMLNLFYFIAFFAGLIHTISVFILGIRFHWGFSQTYLSVAPIAVALIAFFFTFVMKFTFTLLLESIVIFFAYGFIVGWLIKIYRSIKK